MRRHVVTLRPLAKGDEAELLRIHNTAQVRRWWDAPEEDFPWDEPSSTRFTIEPPSNHDKEIAPGLPGHHPAAIHVDHLACDVPRPVRGQEQNGLGDLLRLAETFQRIHGDCLVDVLG